jgi:hypothetical protein
MGPLPLDLFFLLFLCSRSDGRDQPVEDEELLESGQDLEGGDGEGPVVVVHPEWLTEALHTQLFLQLQDVLGQLPTDLDSLKGRLHFHHLGLLTGSSCSSLFLLIW